MRFWALVVKNLPANAGGLRDPGSDPCVWKLPWMKKRQLTPVLLPGESHGQKSTVGYSPQGFKESAITEVAYHACMHRKSEMVMRNFALVAVP